MERRFVLFLVLSFALIIGHTMLMRRLNPPKPQPRAKAPAEAKPGAQDDGGKQGPQKEPEDNGKKPPEQPEEEPGDPPQEAGPAKVDDSEFKRAPGLVTLGSLDPEGPYRFAATLTTKGGAVARIELSDPRYRNLEDGSGYLGHLAEGGGKVRQDDRGPGCLVQVVVPGTPAAKAGLKVGDLITALDREPVTKAKDLELALAKTKPNDTISLTVVRVGKKKGEKLSVTLGRRPQEVVKPEGKDRLSFLLTLHQFDDQRLTRDDEKPLVDFGRELKGLDLWDGYWSLVKFDTKEGKWKEVDVSELRKTKPTEISFQRTIKHLRITKTFRIAKVPEDSPKDASYRAYHLEFDVRVQNIDIAARDVAYQLDGPTGLPVEGEWYASKIARGEHWYNLFARAGLRDVAVSKISEGYRSFDLIGCPTIANDDFGAPGENQSVGLIGVDAKYFAAVLIPQGQGKDKRWAAAPMEVAQWQPLRVGEVNKKRNALTNTSCRLVSQAYPLAPGETLSHRFVIFAGPKTPDVLANYGLGELIYYGWFSALARPMSGILHFFHGIVPNYGLAILMLTVLVRGCMFPLSRKQALGARKMQELQPEIRRIQEKYKNDMEGRTKAQQELFRKHNYNPLSGCLVLFIQLPIFVALYRSLMVDIELRGAPLLWQGIRWCSNLSAPDMLFYWKDFMPGLVVGYLGPYFNILPILTIALFILQQKMFMPPATDEKTAMQQKMMKYMMVFMGVLFFKVASGLCIYFIASSLWGLAERKFLPKASPAEPHSKPATRADAKARDKPRPKPTPQQALSGRDGTAARKKKKKTRRGKR
ncbi:MAG: YidC/Oxa1 family insertase periplasmic-domain containing protein [Planctomycetota bacterium]|jgi:YidC/Oxa1 family membrane protein insertase